jgi:hypothetical protein
MIKHLVVALTATTFLFLWSCESDIEKVSIINSSLFGNFIEISEIKAKTKNGVNQCEKYAVANVYKDSVIIYGHHLKEIIAIIYQLNSNNIICNHPNCYKFYELKYQGSIDDLKSKNFEKLIKEAFQLNILKKSVDLDMYEIYYTNNFKPKTELNGKIEFYLNDNQLVFKNATGKVLCSKLSEVYDKNILFKDNVISYDNYAIPKNLTFDKLIPFLEESYALEIRKSKSNKTIIELK